MPDDLPILEFADAEAFEAWLEQRPERGAWLRFAKRGAARRTVTYAQALEVALCHGWIDGQRRSGDEHHYLQRFTPRRPRSRWSLINVEHAERLIAEGRMRPAGLAQIEAAKADGRWEEAYPPPSRARPDADFAAALEARPEAKAHFESLSSIGRYAFIYRLWHVKRPQERARRIAEYVELLAARRSLHDES